MIDGIDWNEVQEALTQTNEELEKDVFRDALMIAEHKLKDKPSGSSLVFSTRNVDMQVTKR